jgi:uncharacterized protein
MLSTLAHGTSLGLSAMAAILLVVAACQFHTMPSPLVAVSAPGQHFVLTGAAVFLAACVSSTVGFAFSAIAAAMILHLVPNTIEAVQIMMIASIGIQAYSVLALRQTICWKTCLPFLVGGALTIPVGTYLLLTSSPHIYALILGIGLAAYGAYTLVRRPFTIGVGGPLANAAVGALGGVTGPLAAFPGAFVTIWCGARGWDKTVQRSIYQPYILVMQLLTLGALTVSTGQARFDPALLGYAVPGIAGAFLGMRVFRGMSDSQFNKVVNVALVASGLALVINR